MNQMTELYNNLDRVMAMAQYEMIGISVGVVRAEKEDAPGLLVNLSVHYAWKGDVADMGTQMAAILCSRYASSGYKLDDAKVAASNQRISYFITRGSSRRLHV